MWQTLLSLSFPYFEQSPPYLGGGLSHFRDHISYPTPQLTLQFSDLVQLLKFPLTKMIKANLLYYSYRVQIIRNYGYRVQML